jgi:predicted cation transporter
VNDSSSKLTDTERLALEHPVATLVVTPLSVAAIVFVTGLYTYSVDKSLLSAAAASALWATGWAVLILVRFTLWRKSALRKSTQDRGPGETE